MLFPVSGVDVNPFVPPLVAMVVSFFTSMGGVSGAFLLLPFQVSVLGYVAPSVSATNQIFNIVAIPSGVYRYMREGRMVWPLALVVVAGTLPGVFLGAIIRVKYLPDPRHFKLFVGLTLAYIGGRMLLDILKKPGAAKAQAEAKFRELVKAHAQSAGASGQPLPTVHVRECSLKRICYDFYGETFDFPSLGVFGLCLVVGLIGGAYGIGGGSIVAPFFVTFFHLPVYTVAGAALLGTFVTSVAGVAFYSLLAATQADPVAARAISPDWALGALFGLGGMAGMYLGARCQKYFSARFIKSVLCAMILYLAIRYIWEFFK